MTEQTDEARRQSNYETYRRMRTSQNAGDRSGWLDCFTDDVVFEAPYYREDKAPLASGREAMARVFDRMKETFTSVNYQVKRSSPLWTPTWSLSRSAATTRLPTQTNVIRMTTYFSFSAETARSPISSSTRTRWCTRLRWVRAG
jgi:hypothetical protein